MTEDLAAALFNPAWWVLTVIVGLLLNVLAPFINKWIEASWAKRSEKHANQVEAEEAWVSTRVDQLRSESTGRIEAKTDCIYWVARIILLLCAYMVLIQVTFSAPVPLLDYLAIPLAIMAFFHISRYRRAWKSAVRIHNLVCR